MARTIQYKAKLEANGAAGEGDNYRDRLLKYVPAEVLAFFLPITALIANLQVPTDTTQAKKDLFLKLAVWVGAAGSAIWLGINASKQAKAERPLPHMYVLGPIAFLAWAVATNEASAMYLLNSNIKVGAIVMMFVVFVLPVADIGLEWAYKKLFPPGK